jgi:hypothetical protein
MPPVNWIAIVVATVATFILGGLWYGPLFGKMWMAGSGMTEEKAKQGNPARTFGVSFVLQFVAAVILAMFIGPDATLRFATLAGLAVGLGWVATGLGVIYLFEQRPLSHWIANAGYMTVAFTMMGAIIGAF